MSVIRRTRNTLSRWKDWAAQTFLNPTSVTILHIPGQPSEGDSRAN